MIVTPRRHLAHDLVEHGQVALDRSPVGHVDERDHLVEEVVAHVEDVGLLEVDDGVAVGMGGRHVPDLDGLAAHVDAQLGVEGDDGSGDLLDLHLLRPFDLFGELLGLRVVVRLLRRLQTRREVAQDLGREASNRAHCRAMMTAKWLNTLVAAHVVAVVCVHEVLDRLSGVTDLILSTMPGRVPELSRRRHGALPRRRTLPPRP
jgi:hypothetical protein